LPGPPGEEGEEGPASDAKPPANAATTTLLACTIILNAFLALFMYLFLKYLYQLKQTASNKAKAVGY